MLDDKSIFGAAIGLAAGVVKDLLNLALLWLRLIDSHYFHYAAGMLVKKRELHSVAGLIAGGLADFTLSMILGIVFVFLLAATGKRHAAVKGLIFGVAVWFSIYGGLTAFGVTCFQETPAAHDLVQFAVHAVFGLSLGMLAKWRRL